MVQGIQRRLAPWAAMMGQGHRQRRALGAIRALESWWQARRRRRHLRQNLRHLLACDDATLEDIGYRRGDIHRALRLPRTQDALDALHRGAARPHQEDTPS
ncbi:DUF1127 domain-containing protein [Halomonas sp. THAF12]|uniref:DUF1127 domain-containing protein n=1 Tax=Halomonas sp. B23F22_10 TaxID=3459515 RepID=UPI00373E81B6